MPRLQGLCARLRRLRLRRLRRLRPGILCVGWRLRLLWLNKRAALVAALHFAHRGRSAASACPRDHTLVYGDR